MPLTLCPPSCGSVSAVRVAAVVVAVVVMMGGEEFSVSMVWSGVCVCLYWRWQ